MRIWIIGLILILSVGMGFFSEYVKVNINFQLEQGGTMPGFFERAPAERQALLDSRRAPSPLDYYYSHRPLGALNVLDRRELTVLKWVFTLFLVVLYWGLNRLMLRQLVRGRALDRPLTVMYAIAFCLSLSCYAVGHMAGPFDDWYAVSRKISGALQSILPSMLAWPAWILSKRLPKSSSSPTP